MYIILIITRLLTKEINTLTQNMNPKNTCNLIEILIGGYVLCSEIATIATVCYSWQWSAYQNRVHNKAVQFMYIELHRN